MTKKWRVYFNKKEDYPCIWSVDEGTSATEVRVQWFSIEGLRSYTGHAFVPQPPNQPERGENDPTAWIEFSGVVSFQGGGAVFSADGVSE